MSKVIPTQAPNKGDLVKGHRVAMFWPKLPVLQGEVINVSKTGHAVEVEIDKGLSIIMGGCRRTRWTWRPSVKAYQQDCQKTQKGSGLALIRVARK